MRLLQSARRNPWVVVYAAAGLAMAANLLGDAYQRAADVCELYPHFAFGETLREEMAMHHTRLPLVRVHVPTLQLLAAYAAAYGALHLGLLERVWLLLNDVLSGRWLYSLLFERLPACLPFLFSEPGVPELLSDAEDASDGDDADVEPLGDAQPVDAQRCSQALAKLVQVKMQHANRTISRPDDWLVFDPEREDLVLQKHATASQRGASRQRPSSQDDEAKLSLARAQEPLVDDTQQPPPTAARRKRKPRGQSPQHERRRGPRPMSVGGS